MSFIQRWANYHGPWLNHGAATAKPRHRGSATGRKKEAVVATTAPWLQLQAVVAPRYKKYKAVVSPRYKNIKL